MVFGGSGAFATMPWLHFPGLHGDTLALSQVTVHVKVEEVTEEMETCKTWESQTLQMEQPQPNLRWTSQEETGLRKCEQPCKLGRRPHILQEICKKLFMGDRRLLEWSALRGQQEMESLNFNVGWGSKMGVLTSSEN